MSQAECNVERLVPCPRCLAPAGKHCREPRGKVAEIPHAARFRLAAGRGLPKSYDGSGSYDLPLLGTIG